ncbi:unnamed protein product [Danaus chrysippus]|uniref:(African queen) hypothetical protein n=1 Tax=Danaus chrysippus TaxID=151541 RepID=A0A8J2PZZ7_9NEOP|nr:unnamed protein product [Danaus chrysippus]
MPRMMAAVPIALMVLANMFKLSSQKYTNDSYCYCYDVSPYLKTPQFIGRFPNDSVIYLSNSYRRNWNVSESALAATDRVLHRFFKATGLNYKIKSKE